MGTSASGNHEAGNVYTRAAPGGRTILFAQAGLAPVCAGGLVLLDARAGAGLDPVLLAAAGVFTALSCVVLLQAVRRLRGLAAIADAVRAASYRDTTPMELRLSESYGPSALAWNELIPALCADAPGEAHESALKSESDVLDTLADGVLVVDQNLCVVHHNTAATVLLGEPEALGEGVSLERLRDGVLADAARTVLSGGPTQRQILDAGTSDAPQVIRVRAARLGRSRDRVVLTLTDITRQTVAEASRGSFLARATHELRAPLTNLKLYAEQAIEEGDSDPQLRQEALNVIGREVLRLERTVGDLLRVSELESGSIRSAVTEIQIEDMLAKIRESFAAMAESKSIALTLEAPPRLPALRGDRDHIELAIQNLVGNAIKYTPEGGSVVVRADGDEREFTLDVVDTGIGIAPDESTLVFEKFYRSDDDRVHDAEGSGLGLAMAREIARLHGGDITLESELNRGSTFTMRIPTGRAA